ncbi:class I SAM-dependent methyltransferase [Neisseria dumasiana]|uniref:Methyltransferase n=1 Tax=Neisseria dumasiana TaxID=1931275 RepID=A0A1X3DJH6_9NEIS|nr:O-methyltransferase [Neisseria dumasiana]OSI22811.1 methyltransferase [Neisseria dumasiana]
MATHIHNTDPKLGAYLNSIGEAEHPALTALRERMQAHRLGKMAIAPSQASLLTWLARLMRAERYLEVGVFTGYSSTTMALALPSHGTITACDINVTFTDIARETWQAAGIAHKITLHLQPALLTLDDLISAGESETYDIALIDADKPPTPEYYERCLQLVRSGGVIAIDNVLLGGRVLQPVHADSPPAHSILQAFNESLPQDGRIIPITLPVGDGLTLLLKK